MTTFHILGKSSLPNVLPIGLARRKYRVLLIDMEPQSNAYMRIGDLTCHGKVKFKEIDITNKSVNTI